MPVFNNALAGAAGSGGAADYKIKRSLRFNGSVDSAFLNRSPSSAGNRKTWTFSGWVKRSKLGERQYIFEAGSADTATDRFMIRFENTDELTITTGQAANRKTIQVFRDTSSWGHLVVAVDTTLSTPNDRIKVYWNGSQIDINNFSSPSNPGPSANTAVNSATAHSIGKTHIDNGNYLSAYLADVYLIDGQALAATDFGKFDVNTGVWNPIEFSGTYGTNGFHLNFSDNSSDSALGNDAAGSNNWTVNNINANSVGSSAVLGAWTSGWSGSQLGGYSPGNMFDGSTGSLTAFQSGGGTWSKSSGNGIPASSSVELFYILRSGSGSVSVNGNSLGLSEGWQNISSNFSFPTEITSIVMSQNSGNGPDIRAMKVDGKYVVDNAYAANYPYETPDSVIDSPTNYEADSGNNGGNYATLNPLQNAGVTITGGNLNVSKSSGNWRSATGTIGISSGKFYWEYTATTASDAHIVGVCDTKPNLNTYGGELSPGWIYQSNGNKQHNDNWTSGQPTANSGGDIIQVAVDMDAGKIWFGVNNSWIGSGNPSNGTNAAYDNLSEYAPVLPVVSFSGTLNGSFNFGQRPFTYTPPTGFKSLCTQNLDESAYASIADGSKYFDVALDTGANILSSTKALCGGNANFLWIKDRANSSTNHHLIDIVRDPQLDGTPYLISNDTDNEATLGTYSAPSGNSVGWAWNAGSSNTPISAGSLNSSVYDQSQTWSSGTFFNANGNGYHNSNTITKLFDGVCNGVASDMVLPAANGDFTLSFGTTFSSASTVTFDLEGDGNSLKINGSFVTLPGGSRTTVTYNVSGLTSIQWYHGTGSNYVWLGSIKVDGKELVDSGVSVTNFPSIASTVRANPTAGFSIVSYVGNNTLGTSYGHGLNTVPAMIIVKNREAGNENWAVYHKNLTSANKYLSLNTADAEAGNTGWWNDTAPTASVFYTGNAGTTAGNNQDHIAYCFAPVAGYSAFGSYTGNGSTDGPFVYTGFRPRYILQKSTASEAYGAWHIYDTARDPVNAVDKELYASGNFAEGSIPSGDLDILSNGFKMRTNHSGGWNTSGTEYVWAAFAENPFKIARAR